MTTFITIPCFNEANRWDLDYWRDLSRTPDVQLIFVDDGSRDETRLRLRELCSESESHLISKDRNEGKADAVRNGMQWALANATSHDVVGFMDADGAFLRDDVERLIQLCGRKFDSGDWDAVWSSRVALAGRRIRRSARRHYLGRVAATFLFGARSDIPYDTQSGLKFFQPSQDLETMLRSPFQTRWLFEVELMYRYRMQLDRPLLVWEEPLMSWNEVPGSKISGKEILRAVEEILTVKRMYRKIDG